MEVKWKRPKVLPSTTTQVETPCGKVFVTLCYDDERLVEVRGTVGKGGTPCNTNLQALCRLISCYIQSPEPMYKIVKKLDKNLKELSCGKEMEYQHDGERFTGCLDYIVKAVMKELSK